MNLYLYRKTFTDKCTIGELYINNEFECYTLEDVVRPEKIYGDTAIPRGTYDVDITFSGRFQKYLPILRGVSGFSGVRIHPGNTDGDTEGCILVGDIKIPEQNRINNSRSAMKRLFTAMMKSISEVPNEKITLTILEVRKND